MKMTRVQYLKLKGEKEGRELKEQKKGNARKEIGRQK
jgi:hypothetical protein